MSETNIAQGGAHPGNIHDNFVKLFLAVLLCLLIFCGASAIRNSLPNLA